MPRFIGKEEAAQLLKNAVDPRSPDYSPSVPPILLLKESASDRGSWTCYEPGEGAAVARIFRSSVRPIKPELASDDYWSSIESGDRPCGRFRLYRLRPMRPDEKNGYGLHPKKQAFTPSRNTSDFCVGKCPEGCECKMFEGECQCVEKASSY